MTVDEVKRELTENILATIAKGRAEVNGAEVNGAAVSWVKSEAREAGFTGLGNMSRFESICEDLGFSVIPGITLSGTAKGGGVKRNKARVVFL